MPQVGWRDPSTGKEKSFDEWLAEAEAYGSALGYPFEVLYGIQKQLDKGDRPSGVTVTMLNGCARATHLEKLVDFHTEVEENYPAFRGTLAHGLIEKFKPKGAIIEQRYFRRYKGTTVSGMLDSWKVMGADDKVTERWHQWLIQMEAWEGGGEEGEQPEQPVLPAGARFLIRDWKTKQDLPTFTYLFKGHQQQGNLYAWLIRVPSPDILDCEFVFMSMKGVRVMSLFNGGTFRNGRAKPEQIWNERERNKFLDDRLLTLAASQAVDRPLPYDQVPTEDLWQCGYCPARELCHRLAGEEAEAAFKAGKKYDRLPPRDRAVESGKKKPRA
jgi:hypothetical protein